MLLLRGERGLWPPSSLRMEDEEDQEEEEGSGSAAAGASWLASLLRLALCQHLSSSAIHVRWWWRCENCISFLFFLVLWCTYVLPRRSVRRLAPVGEGRAS